VPGCERHSCLPRNVHADGTDFSPRRVRVRRLANDQAADTIHATVTKDRRIEDGPCLTTRCLSPAAKAARP